MNKKWILIFGFLGTASTIMLYNSGRIVPAAGNNCWEEVAYAHSRGVLSTGIVYEYYGEFNFNEFRRQCRYYLERKTGDTIFAETPTEAAEMGQFHFYPGIRYREYPSIHREGVSLIFLVYSCHETNNWVLERQHPRQFLGIPPDNIITINRSNGNVVEFARRRGLGHMPEWTNDWRRTGGVRRFYDLAALIILVISVVALAIHYCFAFLSHFKKNSE